MLGLAESNVSRSIKALIEADLLSKQVTTGYDGRPVWKINPVFEKQALLSANEQYEKAHGKPFKADSVNGAFCVTANRHYVSFWWHESRKPD
jgi:hypothetical protein